jgi:hypothetical protein
MVYKKRTNKNKYSYLQKNQSRKRMYGGSNSNQAEANPTLSSNFNSALNLGASVTNKVVSTGLEKLGETVGIDINKSAEENVNEITKELTKVVNVLNSPQGEELKKEASEVLKDSLEILEPSIKKGEEILSDGAKKLTETGTSMVVTALNEFPPIFAATELSKAVTASAQAGKTIADLTTTGTEALTHLDQQKKKATNLIGKATNLFNSISDTGNKYASKVIGTAQNYVDKYGTNKNMNIQNVNKTFKKYQNQAKMIGGRLDKSRTEFMSPFINKRKTIKIKRRNNKRNLMSRRV